MLPIPSSSLYLLPHPPGLRREPMCLRRGSSEVGAGERSLSIWDLLEHGFLDEQLRSRAKADVQPLGEVGAHTVRSPLSGGDF